MAAKWMRYGVRGLVLIVALGAAGMFAYAKWRGPVLPGYRVINGPLMQNVLATGRVTTPSRAQVGSEITGVVLERRATEGDVVQAGDVLLVLRADELEARVREAEAALQKLEKASRPQAQAALRQAEVQLAQANREAERRTALLETNAIARETLEQAKQAVAVAKSNADQARLSVAALAPGQSEETVLRERVAAARADLAKTTVRAAVSGQILTRNVEPGDLVQPGRVLFEIARDAQAELILPLDEKNLSVIALGQQAQCIADAYPDRVFDAVVSFIAPSVDAERGTLDLRLKVDPDADFLRQDMTVSINIETGRRDQALVLPNDALLDIRGAQASVIVVRDGRAQRVETTLGLRGLAMSEITSGLQAGDSVLISNQSMPVEGSRVRIDLHKVNLHSATQATRGELPVKLD